MYLANADFSEPKLLGTPPGHLHWPKFSPDGDRIRFNVEGAYRSIWEISVEGTDLRRVLPEWEFTNHCCGSWTTDGKYFVFQATRDQRTQIWADRSLYRVNINDKVVEKILQIGEVRTSWGVYGPWVGVDPDGAALVLRDLSIDNIYALDWLAE